MPLISLSSAQALEALKVNGAAQWPRRADETRLHPIARPKLLPGFQLHPGESIFTIGSCFARNVETALQARGFVLPAVEAVDADPAFRELGPGLLNNYGTPSICNEIRWALERDYRDEEVFAPMGAKWVDAHLPPKLRPSSLDICRARREAIVASYRRLPQCRVVIITLGLAEVWLDTATGTYLNRSPRRSMLRRDPGRYQLHVLSFEEAANHLGEALRMLRRHGHEDLRVILTVSPVPLSSTYRQVDVMEANSYSKSVLRAVAEEARAKHDFVDYFPSYESVTLSDRARAWTEDEVHVTEELVRVNVDRMVAAYTGAAPESLVEFKARLGALRPQEQFNAMRASPEYLSDGDVATRFVDVAIRLRKFEAAEQFLDKADDAIGLFAAAIAFSKGDFGSVLNVLKDGKRRPPQFFRLKLRAQLALGDRQAAETTMQIWAGKYPSSPTPFEIMAIDEPDPQKAAAYFTRAMDHSDGDPRIRIAFAERLVRDGKLKAARQLAMDAAARSEHLAKRRMRILEVTTASETPTL